MMDTLVEAGLDTIGIGKIYDIFAGKSIQQTSLLVCRGENTTVSKK